VAAEVAGDYTQLRSCEALLVQTRADVASRSETSRLTELSANAGFQAPADAALARASAAQGRSQLASQQAQCDQLVKALVALTGWQEPSLREQLSPGAAHMPQPVQIAVQQVPAQVLSQRPDVYSAARDVAAAAADTDQAQAQRYPRISLAGSIGSSRVQSAGQNDSGTVWAVGPVQVSLPLFDGGTRAANVDAARSRFDEAASVYRARLRTAVREVEEALLSLQSTVVRSDDARIATEGYEDSLRAAQARFERGAGSLFELEDARRTALQAQSSVIELQRERVSAWISLYRALGGGWSAEPAMN
jgi:outer membrane protein, multidrug efflux system